MNDCAYGLTAAIYTADVEAADRIGAGLETGTVFMNRCDYLDPALCWTGCRTPGAAPRCRCLATRRGQERNPITCGRHDADRDSALTGTWSLSHHDPLRRRPRRRARRWPAGWRGSPGRCWSPTGGWRICRSRWRHRPARRRGLSPAVFADVDPNPSDRNVEMGLKALREGGFDGIIAFGGGSTAGRGQGRRLHVGPDPTLVGFRGCGRLVDPRRPRRHPACGRGAHHRRHRGPRSAAPG